MLLVTVLLAVAGCTAPRGPTARPSASGAASAPSAGPATGPTADPAAQARAIVARLTDEDLVGQVLMPYAYGTSATTVSAGSKSGNQRLAGVDTPAQMIAKYRLGGLILVGFSADDPTATTNPTTNVDSAAQVRDLTTGIQAAAKALPAGVPALIGTDQEYGTVTRIKEGVTQLPAAMAFGAAADPALTEAAWRAAGAELAALGVTVDFAPVADVLGSSGAGVIGSRSYGSDPAADATQTAAAVRGLQAGGVAATLKHFPGHGHTTVDSHTDLPVLTQSRAAWDSGDAPPFAAGVQAGALVVMSGYLDARAFDPGVAAVFSSKVLTDVLRGQLHFDGVVVTDALNMAPAQKYPPGDAAVRALNAGNDILLMPPNLGAAQAGLLAALRSGALPRTRLVDAVTRIVTLKLRLAGTPQPAMSTVNTPDHLAAAAAVAAKAVTVLRGRCSGPLVSGPVSVTAAGGGWSRQRQWLTDALRAAGATVVASGGTAIHLVGYGDGAADLSAGAAVTVAMDAPYVLGSARSATLVATYSSTQASMVALAAVLAGRAPAPGRSPVAVGSLPRTACGTP